MRLRYATPNYTNQGYYGAFDARRYGFSLREARDDLSLTRGDG